MVDLTGGSEQLAFAKATRLPDILKQACTQLEDEREKSRLDKAIIKKQFWQLCYVSSLLMSFPKTFQGNLRRNNMFDNYLFASCGGVSTTVRISI